MSSVRGSALRSLVTLMFIFGAAAYAHEEHHHDHETMASDTAALPDGSLYHLASVWRDSQGRKTELPQLKGKLRVAAMLFTSCTSACPILVKDMQAIEKKLGKKKMKRFEMTVFSLDPGRDNPEALRKFAAKYKLDPQYWKLLTAQNSGDVAELAAALGVRFKKLDNGDFLHSNTIFLFNENGEIVARQEGLGTSNKDLLKKAGKL